MLWRYCQRKKDLLSFLWNISVFCSYSSLRSGRLLVVCPQCDPSLLQPLHSSEHQVSTRNFTLHNFWSRVSQLCSWMSPKKTHFGCLSYLTHPIQFLELFCKCWLDVFDYGYIQNVQCLGESRNKKHSRMQLLSKYIWGSICAKKKWDDSFVLWTCSDKLVHVDVYVLCLSYRSVVLTVIFLCCPYSLAL